MGSFEEILAKLAPQEDLEIISQIIESYGWQKILSRHRTKVFRFGSYCFKVTETNLNNGIYREPLVSKWMPQIYWVHNNGLVYLCDFVEIDWSWKASIKQILEIKAQFQEAGIRAFDLSPQNLVKGGDGRLWILDVGCFKKM